MKLVLTKLNGFGFMPLKLKQLLYKAVKSYISIDGEEFCIANL